MAFDHSGIGDAVLIQIFGKARGDAACDEILQPIGLRFLQLALNIILGDRDLGDLVLLQQRLKLAVWDRCVPCALEVETLDEQHAEHRRDDVPEVDVSLIVHSGPPRRPVQPPPKQRLPEKIVRITGL